MNRLVINLRKYTRTTCEKWTQQQNIANIWTMTSIVHYLLTYLITYEQLQAISVHYLLTYLLIIYEQWQPISILFQCRSKWSNWYRNLANSLTWLNSFERRNKTWKQFAWNENQYITLYVALCTRRSNMTWQFCLVWIAINDILCSAALSETDSGVRE